MKHICSDISDKWSELKPVINEHSSDQITVPLLSFESYKTRKGVMKEKLTAYKRDTNAELVMNFIDELFPVIVNHRNMLVHYRNIKKILGQMFNSI